MYIQAQYQTIENIQRGDIFFGINDNSLNLENYSSLLSLENYTVNFANYNDNNTTDIIDDSVVSNDINKDLYKVSLEKNPILITQNNRWF